jgi:hypothetical protein
MRTATAAQALVRVRAEWGLDPTYDTTPTWPFTIGPVTVPRAAIQRHDLHHILTGYPFTMRGEFQVATWEFAAGRYPHWGATLLLLPLVVMGLFWSPTAIWREIVFAFGWGEEIADVADGLPEGIDGSDGPSAEVCLRLSQPLRHHPLNDCALGLRDFAARIGQHLQAMRPGEVQQLAGAEQEVGVARLAETLVANAKGLVDQHATWPEGASQARKERAMEVVGDDDAVELPPRQRPGRTVLQVGGKDLDAAAGEVLKVRNIPVKGCHLVP